MHSWPCSRTYFNPRSHERSDDISGVRTLHLQDISIHAPTRGATMHPHNYELDSIFQSTLPREERPITHNTHALAIRFQSTLPREERLFSLVIFPPIKIFQSTLPREERQQYCTKNLFIFIQYRQ